MSILPFLHLCTPSLLLVLIDLVVSLSLGWVGRRVGKGSVVVANAVFIQRNMKGCWHKKCRRFIVIFSPAKVACIFFLFPFIPQLFLTQVRIYHGICRTSTVHGRGEDRTRKSEFTRTCIWKQMEVQ